MLEQFKQSLMHFLTASAYDPVTFYTVITVAMCLATVGFPISEEFVIISSALVAYMGAHPELYPPPSLVLLSGQTPVHPATTAMVCFLSVFLSDLFIYMIGFIFREKITNHYFFQKFIPQKRKEKIDLWMTRYGYYVSGMLRFAPGLRLIGYLTCGITRMPIDKFILFNGGVALLVVPTQIWIISIYGESIIRHIEIISVVLGTLVFISIATIFFTHLRSFITK